MATELFVHECGCSACRAGDEAERDDHRQLNLLLSRLDEQQRRWVAGREPGVWGMAESNGLRKSRACIRRRFGGGATNSARNYASGRPTMPDSPAAGVRASKKRSDPDCRPAAVR